MKQLHQPAVFQPIHIDSLSNTEKSRAMETVIFLTEKSNGTIKGQTCANRSIQRNYMTKDEASSPAVMTESTLITATLDSAENRDVGGNNRKVACVRSVNGKAECAVEMDIDITDSEVQGSQGSFPLFAAII
jgi:hypothetical protein